MEIDDQRNSTTVSHKRYGLLPEYLLSDEEEEDSG